MEDLKLGQLLIADNCYVIVLKRTDENDKYIETLFYNAEINNWNYGIDDWDSWLDKKPANLNYVEPEIYRGAIISLIERLEK
jgi:hypothetical protein